MHELKKAGSSFLHLSGQRKPSRPLKCRHGILACRRIASTMWRLRWASGECVPKIETGEQRLASVRSCPLADKLLRCRECPLCAISDQTRCNKIDTKRKTANCGGPSEIRSGVLIKLRVQRLSAFCARQENPSYRGRPRTAGEQLGAEFLPRFVMGTLSRFQVHRDR